MSYNYIRRAFPLFNREDIFKKYVDILSSLENAKTYYLKNLHKKRFTL